MLSQGWAGARRRLNVDGDPSLQTVTAERRAASRGEQRIRTYASALGEPGGRDGDCFRGQRGDALFAALAQLCRSVGNAESWLSLTVLLVLWLLCAF
jgi:hypothetical protein